MENQNSPENYVGGSLDFRWKPVKYGTKFHAHVFTDLRQMIACRNANIKITDWKWIRVSPVVDCTGHIYNPCTPVLLFLN